jgi:adenine-specific DNA-methyltransferase
MLEYNNAVFDNKQNNKVFNLDVFDVIAKNNTDIIYLDPPYTGTMNDYFGFYGVIDSYVDSKKHPPFFNNFIDKKQSLALFKKLFASLTDTLCFSVFYLFLLFYIHVVSQ